MPAYVVNHLHILDAQAAAQYRAMAERSVHAFGGRYLARAADANAGDGRVVIIEFSSLEAALSWKESEAYRRTLQTRDRAMRCTMLVVDGLGSG